MKRPDTSAWPPKYLYAIPFLSDVAGMLLIFAVGRSLAEQGHGLLVLGLVGAGHAIGLSVSSIVSGPLSDRFGRSSLILPGMVVFFAASIVCAVSETGGTITLVMYWLSAVSLGMIHPPTIAWVNSGSPASRSVKSHTVSRNLIRFCISWNAGVLVAQAGGGQLYLIGIELPYVVAAAVMAVNLVVVSFAARRSIRDAALVAEQAASVGTDVAAPGSADGGQSGLFVRLAWLANLGGAVAVSMLLHLFPSLAVSLGIPADRHGAILASMRVIAIGVYILMHRTGFWHFKFAVNLVVQAIAVSGLLIVFLARSTPALMLGVGLIAILLGYNYFLGIYYGSAGHDESRRGFASGMHEATLGLGIAIGSAGGGLLGSLTAERVPYLLAAIVVGALMMVQSFYYLRTKKAVA